MGHTGKVFTATVLPVDFSHPTSASVLSPGESAELASLRAVRGLGQQMVCGGCLRLLGELILGCVLCSLGLFHSWVKPALNGPQLTNPLLHQVTSQMQ